jgi:hypothetical protein
MKARAQTSQKFGHDEVILDGTNQGANFDVIVLFCGFCF